MSKWKPIETAPRDGQCILGWDGEYLNVAKHYAGGWMVVTDENWTGYDPTHWQPLPEPPETE